MTTQNPMTYLKYDYVTSNADIASYSTVALSVCRGRVGPSGLSSFLLPSAERLQSYPPLGTEILSAEDMGLSAISSFGPRVSEDIFLFYFITEVGSCGRRN